MVGCKKHEKPAAANARDAAAVVDENISLEEARARDHEAFAELTGTADVSSSGGLIVSKLETIPAGDAAMVQRVVDDAGTAPDDECLRDSSSSARITLEATGGIKTIAGARPCFQTWLETLDFPPPPSGRGTVIELSVFFARE